MCDIIIILCRSLNEKQLNIDQKFHQEMGRSG